MPNAFKQADVQRALKAAQREGFDLEIQPDGTLRFLTRPPEEPQRDDLETWRARRDASKSARAEPRRKTAGGR